MASSHGKIILLGEHAVVYGVPALAVGIDRGASAVVGAKPDAVFTINGQPAADAAALEALTALRSVLAAPELSVEAELTVMPGAGLGASAALAVAIAKAFLERQKLIPTSDRVLPAAEAWEKVFHGNPSGIDTTAAYFGGCFTFRRGHAPEFIEPLQPLRLAVAKAGPAASTKAMVESVANLRKRRPELVDKTLEGIRSLVRNAALCLLAGDLQGLGKLMDYNQMLLSGWFLSTPEIENACRAAREEGAWGAKLTGAGGGGAVIALAEDPDKIVAAWHKRGISGFVANCGASETPATASTATKPVSGSTE